MTITEAPPAEAPLDPEVERLYVELGDLNAASTNYRLEAGRKLLDLQVAGQSQRDIAVKARDLGIDGCSSQSQVQRLSVFAEAVNDAQADLGESFSIPGEGSIRRLLKGKDPAGNAWTREGRLEFLERAFKMASEEGKYLTSRHINAVLEERYPKPPKPDEQKLPPRIRKVMSALNKLAREHGADAVVAGAQSFIEAQTQAATNGEADGDEAPDMMSESLAS